MGRKIKNILKFVILPLFILYVILTFFPIVDPFNVFMARIAAHKYMKDTYNQDISIRETEGNLAAYINHGAYVRVYCSLKEYPDFDFVISVNRGSFSVRSCSYAGNVFEYAAARDIYKPLADAFGEQVNINYEWIYPPDKNSFNAFSDFNSEALKGRDINDVSINDFKGIIDGCKINVYANTLLGEYKPDSQKIYDFAEYCKNILPGKDCDFTIRLKTKDGLSSKEVSFSLNEINSPSDIEAITGA